MPDYCFLPRIAVIECTTLGHRPRYLCSDIKRDFLHRFFSEDALRSSGLVDELKVGLRDNDNDIGVAEHAEWQRD